MRNLLRKFVDDDKASYGTAFALMLVPLFGTAALAVDFSNAAMVLARGERLGNLVE
jgi:Flp pilus assembly protein TadG